MVFLDPKVDIVFKKLFGTETHKNILISFLNAIIGLTGPKQIVDVAITDPANLPELKDSKSSIVDVRCRSKSGSHYIIEMQMVDQKDFAQRAEYYTALALGRQLKKCDFYKQIDPVIFVGILNFEITQSKSYISHWSVTSPEVNERIFNSTEYHLAELPKFQKKVYELENITDKWLFFMKQAAQLTQIPDQLADSGPVSDAFHVLEMAGWTEAELMAYEKSLDDWRVMMSQHETAMEKGMAKGMEKGIEKGAAEKARAIASQLLKLHDEQTVAQITGLSIEEVKSLKK